VEPDPATLRTPKGEDELMSKQKGEAMKTTVLEVEETLETPAGFKLVDVALSFTSYIGLPYWPERNFLINVGKEVHPKLQGEKREAALRASIEKMGKTMEEYERAKIRAARPFYTLDDRNPDLGDGEIIIPERHFLSFLNHVSQTAPKAIPRISNKGLTFIGVRFATTGFSTAKTISNAKVFGRFVKMEESNQRSYCESLYIDNFVAEGRLRVDESIIRVPDLLKLVQYGGKYVGIGSARPQGYGRFTVTRWDA
jgi:hypothetical protein